MLNFRKRLALPPKLEQEEVAGTLAIWGSPGCGKTTVAVKLAQQLVAKGQRVALLLCDLTTPMLPCICPPDQLEGSGSLSYIFSAESITPQLVQYHCHAHKRLDNLLLLGLRKGENESSGREPTPEQVGLLLHALRELASCVLVDCTSHLLFDPLSTIAIQQADASLRLVSGDLKSISYLSSQLPYLLQSGLHAENQYKVISNQYPEQAEIMRGEAVFHLPHSQELWEQMQTGNLLSDLSLKESRTFRQEITKICMEVFGI